ncbi:MAG: LytR C-terminal domain-containing protein, partial [Candidatus Levybacteria bacterium]|nr:LytR C-terminal domain-containing protein [Candidatus Levybacteria bacterium]
LLLVGVFLYKYGISIKDKVNVVTLVPTPTAAPEPTKAIDLTKYEIEIQNGGGVSGEAGRQEASLGGEGFTISSIGNADNSDYADTLIKAKAEVEKAFLDKLKSVLENTFTLGEIETLSESSSVPVVVIIGTKK